MAARPTPNDAEWEITTPDSEWEDTTQARPDTPEGVKAYLQARYPKYFQEEAGPVSRFMSNLGSGLAGAVTGPIELAKQAAQRYGEERAKGANVLSAFGSGGSEPIRALIKPQIEQFKKMSTSESPVEAAGHALAGALPLVGPAAAHIGEQIGEGDVAGGVGQAASLLLPEAVMRNIGRIPGQEALRTSAQKQYARVLDPTGKRFKVETTRVVQGKPGVPGLLERGTRAMSREGLLRKFESTVKDVGDSLDQLFATLPPDQGVPLRDIRMSILKNAREEFALPTPTGMQIPSNPEFARGLRQVQNLVENYVAPHVTPDPVTGQGIVPYATLRRLKRDWDKIVKEAGGFDERPGRDLIQNIKAMGYREAASGIREELAKARPDIGAVNREFSFWKDAQDVMRATLQRKESQAPRLGEHFSEAAGIMGGFSSGGFKGAVIGGKLMKNMRRLVESTAWSTTSAVFKNRLADALAKGDVGKANAMVLAQLADMSMKKEEE